MLVSLFVWDFSFNMLSADLLSTLFLIRFFCFVLFLQWQHGSCGFNATLALFNLIHYRLILSAYLLTIANLTFRETAWETLT